MTMRQVNELLETASEQAPRVDVQQLAVAARLGATKRRRGRIVVGPTVVAVIAVAVVATVMTQSRSTPTQPGSPVPSASAPAIRGVIYTCCSDSDVAQLVRPGGTFVVHWMVKPSAGDAQIQILGARLTGPYASVDALKSGSVSAPSYPATAITLSGAPGSAPVSVIHVPADAKPGLYQLISTTAFPVTHDTGGGSSVVTIAP